MASRKNRSRKANRKSPQLPPGLGERLRRRFEGLFAWFEARRWVAVVVGALLLFGASLVGGYWLAERLEGSDGDRLARDTLEEMKRGSATDRAEIRTHRGSARPAQVHRGRAGRGAADAGGEAARQAQLAAAASSAETWRRNAVPFRDLNSKPLVAVVIDDVGLDRPRSKRAWELPGPLTLSFLPYAKDLREQAKAARARGHELMLHLPMEPNGRNDPGPNALLVSLSDAELRQRTTAALDSFDGYAGVNNHMGSRFTAFKPGMETVLRQFKGRGLMFLDSRTSAQSVGDQLAQEMGVPSIVRHVFLDDDESLDAVRKKLAEAEAIARRQGFVVVIGHPHEATLQALGEWLPGVQGKGLALAPATAVLRKRNGWD